MSRLRLTPRPVGVIALTVGLSATTVGCGAGETNAEPTGDESSTAVGTTAATTSSATGAVTQSQSPEPGKASSITVETIATTPPDVAVSGLDMLQGIVAAGAPEPLVPLGEIRSGGPPPDGIPSIDDPMFAPTDDVDFLADNEPVVAIDIDGDARAYPVQILIWHEIVNDTVGGVPVAVTYCPLCNSALGYDRRVDHRVVEFGTSGSLWNSALVLYDRQTETLWSHFTGTAIVGELTGTELETYPMATVAWGDWRDAHPFGLVLSQDTGFDREYGRNPYPGYDDVNTSPFLFEGEIDGRYAAKTRIVGIEVDGNTVGIGLETLERDRVVATDVGDTPVVAFWAPGTASALDQDEIVDGADVGATGVFDPEVDQQSLTFHPDPDADDRFIDNQTNSTWNIFGHAIDGPLNGSQLRSIDHVDTFWFAWSAFYPDSDVVDG